MGAGMAVKARKLAGGLLQGAVVFFAALSLRILYGLLLNFPPSSSSILGGWIVWFLESPGSLLAPFPFTPDS